MSGKLKTCNKLLVFYSTLIILDKGQLDAMQRGQKQDQSGG